MANKRLGHWLLAGAGLLLVTGGIGCNREPPDRGPRIVWWATRPHADRGPCTACHTRTDGQGLPLPSITSASHMPHLERGVCSNCHPITVDGQRVVVTGPALPAAQVRPLPPGQRPMLQGVPATPALPATQTSF